ncbi:RNA-directed DNA polymerase, eukaryota, partial [Tanacetum coccineum]
RQMSVVHIEHGETTERGKPKVAKLSDPRLRTIDRKMKCETFMANVAELLCDACASIAPRSLQMSFEFILKLKHEFCYNLLGYVAIEYSDLLLIDLLEDHKFNQARKIRNPKNRLKKILDACKSKSKCVGGDEIVSRNQDGDEPLKKSRGGCGAQQPKITIEGMKMVAEQLPEQAERKQQLSAERVLSVLKWISDEDCLLLGLNPKYARLDWMLLQFHVATYFDNELPGQPRCTVLHSSITTETICAALEGVSESYLEEPEESAEFTGRKQMTVLPYCGFPARQMDTIVGPKRSVEDEVMRISTSVFVTNFPEQSGAKELWNACKQYGQVVDAFIPNRRSKLAIDSTRILNVKSNSYVHAVRGSTQGNMDNNDIPVMVLDEEYVNQEDYSCCLNEKVKDFEALMNLKTILGNEGFNDVAIRYLGGMWVMLKFKSTDDKDKFKSGVGIGSLFSMIIQTSHDVIVDGRFAWVEVEGIPLKVWSVNTFKKIASKWGSFLSADNSEEDCYHSKRLCILTAAKDNIMETIKITFKGKPFWLRVKEVPGWYPDFDEQGDEESESEDKNDGTEQKVDIVDSDEESLNVNEDNEVPETIYEDGKEKSIGVEESFGNPGKHSEDPFNIYSLLEKKNGENKLDPSKSESLKFPPGFTPSMEEEAVLNRGNKENYRDRSNGVESEQWDDNQEGFEYSNVKKKGTESAGSGSIKKVGSMHTGGSLLNVMDELIKENKMESIELFDVKRCWGNFTFDYVHSNSVGNSGGILCVWDTNSFKKINVTISDYFVMIRGDWVSNGNSLLIISVYAPQDLSEKKMLWDYLGHVIDSWKGEVIIMGDFNEVRYKNERFGSNFNVQGANAFNSFIGKAGLEEVPLGGCTFTWCHKLASKMSKLDRFLISENLLSSCPNISAITLDRFLSDHRPILLRESSFDYGPTPLLVRSGWNLKKKIRAWNGARQSARSSKLPLLSELADVDQIIDRGNALAIEGDENSKYYHGILNKQRSHLAIRGVLVSGIWIENPNLVKNEFLNHFKNRFESPKKIRPIITMDFPRHLNSTQQIDMEADVTNEEIKKAVWDCGSDKSPGPDGFSIGFYRYFWNIIEKDVVAAVKHFFQFGIILKGCNSSCIALIPKIPDAKMVKDFRPISLIGSLYKIIAKILANRLVTVLGDLVNEVQSAFVADRQILDGPFILNEILQWYGAVGSVNVFGLLGDRFCTKYEDFNSQHILIMESLHLSFQNLVEAGMFKGIALDPSTIISHMFYADDAVFVGQWDNSNINTVIYALKCFEKASGLCINMSKSKIMGIAVNDEKVNQVAYRIGCGIINVPFTYLGSKVGGCMSRSQAWSEVVDKINARLSKWKMKTLSIGGRLTLLKSVLGSMSIYHMSIFKVPLGVLRVMESIPSRFFNGVNKDSKKAVWMNWNKVLAAKDKGGLGVSSLYALNRALLFKWVWRFTTHKSSLWARVITAIHEVDGNIDWQRFGHKFLGGYLEWFYTAQSKEPRSGVEAYQLGELSNHLEGLVLGVSSDRWYWSLEGAGEFSVASVIKLIEDIRLPEVSSQSRWIKAVPIKVNVLAWKVRLDGLPSRLNISRRGIYIPSILCPICDCEVEYVSHVFFKCHVANDIFKKICRWWNVEFVDIKTYDDWI